MKYEDDGTITFESNADMAICLASGFRLQDAYGNILYFDDENLSYPFRSGEDVLTSDDGWGQLSGWTEYNEYSGFKKDDKVIVRYRNIYYKRHFAECLKGRAYCYKNGCSSFTSGSIEEDINFNEPELVEISFCVEATPENIDKYIKQRSNNMEELSVKELKSEGFKL